MNRKVTIKPHNAPKRLTTLEIFERYVRHADLTNAHRSDPHEYLQHDMRKRELETLLRERLSFGSPIK